MFQVPWAIALGTWNLFDYIGNLIERIKQYTFVFCCFGCLGGGLGRPLYQEGTAI